MGFQTMDSIIERFNAIWWHDSKLLALSFYRTVLEEQLRISVQIIGEGGALTPAEIVFKECTYVGLEVYLAAKRVCSDDISDAHCHATSEWIKTLSAQNPYDSFEGYLHFRISLCPPGGTINILAKDFSVAAGEGDAI